MARMVYDVTQLAHWQGNITGIPRVMEQLALRFRRTDPNAIFVVWVKELNEFCEINLERTLSHRGHGIAYLQRDESAPQYKPGSEAPQTIEGSSQQVRRKLTLKRLAKAGLHRSARYSPHVSAALERRAQNWQAQHYKQIVFKGGDQLFVPWGEWGLIGFIDKLEECNAKGVEIIQILHDMSPVVVPQYSNSGNATETFPIYMRRVLPISKLVLVVSENSKKDALAWLKQHKLPIPTMKVFRTGDDIKVLRPEKPDDAAFRDSKLEGDDFILCVGTIELKKNHMLFYYVYKLASSRGIKLPKLVIAGRRGWMTEATFELMTKDPEVANSFVFQLDKNDAVLSWLYSHCLFTVLPSFYEGWGIPIAESLARGVPCICSNSSSMTEVGKGFTAHFTPSSPEECLAAIQEWLVPAKLKSARELTSRYKPFSWDSSFAQVKKYLEELH